jgi:prophage regulatory protein
MRTYAQSIGDASRFLIASARLGIVVTGASRCSLHGNIVMRILSKRQLKELVLYSAQHIARLERAGQFPKRVHLGPSRVGWVEAEVLDWLQKQLDFREAPSRHSF